MGLQGASRKPRRGGGPCSRAACSAAASRGEWQPPPAGGIAKMLRAKPFPGAPRGDSSPGRGGPSPGPPGEREPPGGPPGLGAPTSSAPQFWGSHPLICPACVGVAGFGGPTPHRLAGFGITHFWGRFPVVFKFHRFHRKMGAKLNPGGLSPLRGPSHPPREAGPVHNSRMLCKTLNTFVFSCKAV